MFSKTIKYTVMACSIWMLSACSNRTIILTPTEEAQQAQPVKRPVRRVVKRPVVHEEILIKKNPNLGTAISRGNKNSSTDKNTSTLPSENILLGEPIVGGEELTQTILIPVDETPVARPLMERMPFPEDEYKRLRKRGRSTVSGSIYLLNSYNEAKIPGKKVRLWLNPVTSYSQQWYQESYLGGYRMGKPDRRLINYLKMEYSNASGNFRIFGVPTGSYYLSGTITCAEECGFQGRKTIQIVKEIYVGSGTTHVELMKHVP